MDDDRAVLRSDRREPREGNGRLGLIWHRLIGGRRGAIGLALLLALAGPLYAPQVLAFPYKTSSSIGTVWSERPLDPQMLAATADIVRARMATSPLAGGDERRPIFVTTGGWRWKWLSMSAGGSFGLSRPLTKAVVVNSTDPVTGTIANGRAVGGERDLASVLAHEFTHGLIRRRFGLATALAAPAWKVEGYCDHVAGKSSLTKAEVDKLEAQGEDHPGVFYYRGRQRVEAELRRNGGDVAALFADPDE